MSNVLEPVARAVAIAAIHRRYPNADHVFVASQADRRWPEYQPDARLVMATINRMVEAEAFADAVENAPAMPVFLMADAANDETHPDLRSDLISALTRASGGDSSAETIAEMADACIDVVGRWIADEPEDAA